MKRVIQIAVLALAVGSLSGCFEIKSDGESSDICEAFGKREACADWEVTHVCDEVTSSRTVCKEERSCRQYTCVGPDRYFAGRLVNVKLRDLSQITVDRAMNMIADADIQTAAQLGFAPADAAKIVKGERLSDERIQRLADRAEVSIDIVRTKMDQITASFQEQRLRSDSAYWQTCIQSGSWATPNNLNCQKAFWPGCSPETGANLCITKDALSRVNPFVR